MILRAGLLYFGLVFAAGFALGAVRTLLLEPAIGELAAVLIEAPVILGISWLVCRRVARRLAVPARPGPRLAMGGVALGLLLLAELGLGLAFGRSPGEQLHGYGEPARLVGLLGQVAFGAFPVLQLPRRARPRYPAC